MIALPSPELVSQSVLINDFFLTPAMVSSLDKYYLLHWTGAHLKEQIRFGIIHHQDVSYIAILPDFVRDKFFASKQLRLSFRKPKHGNPYVLVRFL